MNVTTTVRGLAPTARTSGAPDDQLPSILLLHGAGGNAEVYAPLLERGFDGLHVVAPSLPGRLGSEGAPLGSVAEMASWCVELCAALGLERVVVVGHSLGGGVAIEMTHGTWSGLEVSGTVLISTGARLRVHPVILAWTQQVADGADFDATALLPFVRDPDGVRAAAYGRAIARTPGSTLLADWLAADGFDRLGQALEGDGPVMVMVGEADRLTPPKYAHALAAAFRHAELRPFPDAGHMLPFERPDEVVETIARFARALARSASGDAC